MRTKRVGRLTVVQVSGEPEPRDVRRVVAEGARHHVHQRVAHRGRIVRVGTKTKPRQSAMRRRTFLSGNSLADGGGPEHRVVLAQLETGLVFQHVVQPRQHGDDDGHDGRVAHARKHRQQHGLAASERRVTVDNGRHAARAGPFRLRRWRHKHRQSYKKTNKKTVSLCKI